MTKGGNKLPQGCTVVPPEKRGLCGDNNGLCPALCPRHNPCIVCMGCAFFEKTKGCAFLWKIGLCFFRKKLPPLGHVWLVRTRSATSTQVRFGCASPRIFWQQILKKAKIFWILLGIETDKGTVRLERCEFFPKLAKTVPYGLKWRGKIEKSAIEASPKI
jgi:hypothetical protein